MTSNLEAKLQKLPTTPGIYFHKNADREIIYVGKASNLRNRVRQYFQKSRYRDPKTDLLVAEIDDFDWTPLDSEIDALLLEAEMVRRYMPRYNILLRDDKTQQYVRVDYKSDYPTVSLVRRPLDDGAEYFGPYLNSLAIKRALKYLRRAFPYAVKRPIGSRRASLYYHLGLDPGLEDGHTSLEQYRANLTKLMLYLKGQRVALIKDIEREMKQSAAAHDFEKAAKLRNQLFALRELSQRTIFGDKEALDTSRDHALQDLTKLLNLAKVPKRIEGFDISHMQGTDSVASMVVFTGGIPDKTQYRKFKMRLRGNDDFAHLKETISRRLSARNRKSWGLPDLMLIDGGKGQLNSAIEARGEAGLPNLPIIGLAKQEEILIVHRRASLPGSQYRAVIESASGLGAWVKESADYITISLPASSPIVKLLQRIRDESHRFALSYHSVLKQRRQSSSRLDEIPGVGLATRKKIIRHFGSVQAAAEAAPEELQKLLGDQRGQSVARHLKQTK